MCGVLIQNASFNYIGSDVRAVPVAFVPIKLPITWVRETRRDLLLVGHYQG
jgi:hypothetical protein